MSDYQRICETLKEKKMAIASAAYQKFLSDTLPHNRKGKKQFEMLTDEEISITAEALQTYLRNND